MSYAKTLSRSLLLLGPAALLAGCGGGGGGGTSNNPGGGGGTPRGSILGKVVDLSGNPVATAKVYLLPDNQPQLAPPQVTAAQASNTATFSQGGYEVDGVTPGFYIVYVTTADGKTGSTQVLIVSGSDTPTTNANVVVSPPSQQATIHGTVAANGSNKPLPNAQVFLRTPITSAQSSGGAITGYSSLSAFTFGDGSFDLYNVPVYQADGTTTRTYTAAAAYESGATVYDNVVRPGLTFTSGQVITLPGFSLMLHSGGFPANSATPQVNLLQAFTQPDIPSVLPPTVNGQSQPSAAARAAVYEQIRRLLSPAYAQLSAGRHAAAAQRLHAVGTRAQSFNYSVEMDLFFSLPGETAGQTPDSPERSQLYGFDINSNAPTNLNPTGKTAVYDILVDPLANFYDDNDTGTARVASSAGRIYFVDTPYQLSVDSIGADAHSLIGYSNAVQASPLSFVNLTQPLDPNDQNLTISTLSNPAVLTWSTVDPATGSQNSGVAHYDVMIYSAFPSTGVQALPVSADGQPGHQPALPGTQNTYTLPSSLLPGTEYWVVVAATAADNTATSQAISVSQIVPFFVH